MYLSLIKKKRPSESIVLEELNSQQQNQEPVAASVLTANVYYEGVNHEEEPIQAQILTENPYYE